MPQSIWKGSISFGLVSIPIRLFSATEEKDISFRQVHREDGGRIRYKRVCSVDGEEVPYSDIAKGYELPDGEMVVLDDDDFANLPISSSRAVEVLSFVPAEQIDAVQMGKPYYCDPTGDAKPYVLLRDALDNAERVAIVKVALRQRERLAVLRPREGVLVMQTLLWPDEVRAAKLDFLDEDVTVRSQELTMAESYISALSADFDPGEFSDHYREALEEVIEAKVAGREIVTPEEQPESSGQVVDLMEALRRSVAEAKSRRGETGGAGAAEPAASKTAKAPAKKAAAKTAGASAKSTGKKAAKAPAKKTASKTTKTAKASKKPAKSTAKKTATRKSA
jgi:DNA end-binding protein Ku